MGRMEKTEVLKALPLPEEERRYIKESPLYTHGLISDAFLDAPQLPDSRRFLYSLVYNLAYKKTHGDVAGDALQYLIDRDILTREMLQQHISAPPKKSNEFANNLATYLCPTSERFFDRMRSLVEEKIMTQHTFWNFFYARSEDRNSPFGLENFMLTDWRAILESGAFDPEKMNAITYGFDGIEPEALFEDLAGTSERSRHYRMMQNAHPTALKLRAQEHVSRLSSQIEAILGPSPEGSLLVQLEKVFDHYKTEAPLYEKVLKRDRISPEKREREREDNIDLVNQMQEEFTKESAFGKRPDYDPHKRYLDLYPRYGHLGFMDPLQHYFIAKTVSWYVTEGRSRLFNGVRVVPYESRTPARIAWLTLAACPSAKLLKVRGERFLTSLWGANRMFLTHSDSREASRMGSIPIIGTATAESATKRISNPDEVVVFRADFDPKDPYRGRGAEAPVQRNTALRRLLQKIAPESMKVDVAGDIAGLINETLRSLMEVEEKEITRAARAARKEAA